MSGVSAISDRTSILIVEDDPITRFMMREICDQLGYPHEEASNGAECLAMIGTDPTRAGIVLMDIHMPGLSGVDVCSGLRDFYRDRQDCPIIIALTADEFWQSPENTAAAGFDHVICKPISIKVVDRTLESARRRSENCT